MRQVLILKAEMLPARHVKQELIPTAEIQPVLFAVPALTVLPVPVLVPLAREEHSLLPVHLPVPHVKQERRERGLVFLVRQELMPV